MINKNANLIARELKTEVEKKYSVVEMKLFGSSARGDNTENSDIDILVKLQQVDRKIEEDLFNMAYEFELKYDCLIDIVVIPANMDMDIPIYSNIEKEGLVI